MAYAPVDQDQLIPGLGGDQELDNLGAAHDQLWQETWGPIVSGAPFNELLTATAWTKIARCRVRQNLDGTDGVDVRIGVCASMDSGQGRVRVNVASTDYGSATTVTTTLQRYQATVTPSVAGAQDVWLEAQVDAGKVMTLHGANAWLHPTAAPVEGTAYSSGFRPWTSHLHAADHGVHSEQISRLIRAPYQIARDRLVFLSGGWWMIGESPIGTRTAQDPKLLLRGYLVGDGFERDYRVDLYVAKISSTPTHKIQIIVGDRQSYHEAAVEGWISQTYTTAGRLIPWRVLMGQAGTGVQEIQAVQIWREAA